MPTDWDDAVRGHRDRQRQLIVDTTMTLVRERGLSDVTMAEVAKLAGIGRATLYRYFPGVEEIVAAHVLETVQRHHRTLEAAVADAPDPIRAIRAFLLVLLQYFASTEHRTTSASVNPEQFSPDVGRHVHSAFARVNELMAELVVEAQRAGELRDDVDPSFTAQLLYQMLAAGRTSVVAGTLEPEQAVEQIMGQFLHGAGATTGE